MSRCYVFKKAPDINHPLYEAYIEKFNEYTKQQIIVGNDPGDVLGYVYNVCDITRSFDISKRSARRLINHWSKSGVLVPYKPKYRLVKVDEGWARVLIEAEL